MTPRLITIPISHYCERARWALDACGVAYEEEQHLQGFSRRVTKPAGTTTVPVLVTAEGALTDSGEIVRYADRHRSLYPDDARDRAAAEALERELAGDFGVETRRAAYAWFLRAPGAARVNAGRAPAYQRATVALLFPLLGSMIKRALDVNDETVRRAHDVVDRAFDTVAERLGDRPYLGGDRFGAVDLTFAALAAPCVLPAEYGGPLPSIDDVPADVAPRIRAWREHPAGAFALRLYRDHRREGR